MVLSWRNVKNCISSLVSLCADATYNMRFLYLLYDFFSIHLDSIQMHIIVEYPREKATAAAAAAYASVYTFFFSFRVWNAVAMNVMWYANSSVVAAAFHCRFVRTESRNQDGCINISISYSHTWSSYMDTVVLLPLLRFHRTLTHTDTNTYSHAVLGSQNSARAAHVPIPLPSFAIRVMLTVAWLWGRHRARPLFCCCCYNYESIAMPYANGECINKKKEEEKRQLPAK